MLETRFGFDHGLWEVERFWGRMGVGGEGGMLLLVAGGTGDFWGGVGKEGFTETIFEFLGQMTKFGRDAACTDLSFERT